MTAELLIKQEIDRKGPMDFATFIQLALYHPVYGYYNQKKPVRGRSGDYFTSLQVSSLFPKIMADVIIDMKKTIGTDQFALVEVGSGDGEFLLTVLEELRAKEELKGTRVWAVEASRTAREKLARALSRFPKCEIVSSLDEIESNGGLEGVLFSNELFDALPFKRARYRNGKWLNVVVKNGSNGSALDL